MFFLAVLCWTYTWYLKVETLEADPSRNNDAVAEEVIVESNDFMTVIFKSIFSKHNKHDLGNTLGVKLVIILHRCWAISHRH